MAFFCGFLISGSCGFLITSPAPTLMLAQQSNRHPRLPDVPICCRRASMILSFYFSILALTFILAGATTPRTQYTRLAHRNRPREPWTVVTGSSHATPWCQLTNSIKHPSAVVYVRMHGYPSAHRNHCALLRQYNIVARGRHSTCGNAVSNVALNEQGVVSHYHVVGYVHNSTYIIIT